MLNGELVSVQNKVILPSVSGKNTQYGDIFAYVFDPLPDNFDMILGLGFIRQFGLHIVPKPLHAFPAFSASRLQECRQTCQLEQRDFIADFNGEFWTIKWKWKNNRKYESSIPGYTTVDNACVEEFDKELQLWVNEGILVKHSAPEHGRVMSYLPLIGIKQVKGNSVKVRPVLDYRRLNKNIESYSGKSVPICADRLRQWRQQGVNASMLDLKKAYLQIRVDRELWVNQAVKWKGETYLLTRLGFGLSIAPKIMTNIVEYVISSEPEIKKCVSSYIDDLFVKEDSITAHDVQQHFRTWGLETKEPEKLGSKDGVRVLGVKVNPDFTWKRDQKITFEEKALLTRRDIHKIVGKLVSHVPVAGWLRPACAYIQRLTAESSSEWDAEVDQKVIDLVENVLEHIRQDGDPANGIWPVNASSGMTLWTDASSIAIGVVIEIDGDIVEDGCWLRPKHDTNHINISELQAVIRGINMAVKWGNKDITLKTDSKSVFSWLESLLNEERNIKTKAMGELLIRRRMDVLEEIIRSENLNVKVEFVKSADNLADKMTRLYHRLSQSPSIKQEIKKIHEKCHMGVARTLSLAKERFGKDVRKDDVSAVVKECKPCSRIDPALNFKWKNGVIETNTPWDRWAIDITYISHQPYLSCVDCSSRYTVWRRLSNETAEQICGNLRQIIAELGPPKCLLSDNGVVFHSKLYKDLLKDWDIVPEYACAYRHQGNGIVERMHRTIKRMVGRTRCTVENATFWYNNTCRGTSCPYEIMFRSTSKKPGVCSDRKQVNGELQLQSIHIEEDKNMERNPFLVGDRVYLRIPEGKCDREWTGPHVVTALISDVAVVVNDDGIRRHISHLRLCPRENRTRKMNFYSESCLSSDSMDEIVEESKQERQSRVRKKPEWHKDYVFY